MMAKSKLISIAQINGKPVSFFTPPHDEPDFLWVDVQELAAAFLPAHEVAWAVETAQKFGLDDMRPTVTIPHGDRLVSIVSHPFAQGLCGFIDVKNGYPADREEWGGGPAGTAYIMASEEAQLQHRTPSFEETFAAFKNQGGPSMRPKGERK